LAASAILTRDRSKAVQALAVHPLIGSYPLAEKLVAAFLEAHAALIGEWQ
ncbi:MAG: glycoside hydrolase, partial [Anaerolineae bacterium]|nr:glycoside hydrolase [Anaerolineae bacterium]